MNLKEILHGKGGGVYTTSPSTTLDDVVQQMNRHRCGSLVVCDGERMVGIISERDILRTLAQVAAPLESITVESRMTTDVITGSPGDDVNQVMSLMTQNRIRHLPVMEDEKLIGLVSIGDVVKAHVDRLIMENHMLLNYINS